ncbi:MAG TPA: hypothetical protein VGV59_00385 [Pyrinomonadaceae bacterium]|nr:hypothetical protein [Pyrinomonadaceae bacterium]
MRYTLLAILTLALLAPSVRAQTENSQKPAEAGAEASLVRLALVGDLQALEAEAAKLDNPLARASAKASIADAAWTLDGEWARRLLREAIELLLPAEEERKRARQREVGAGLTPPTASSMARGSIRRRVFDIANRDRAFAEELSAALAREMGKLEENELLSSLGQRAADAGDLESAADYILRAVEAEPTVISPALSVRAVGERDRAAADRLILQYIERLRALPVSVFVQHPSSLTRVNFALTQMLRSETFFDGDRPRNIGTASPATYRAYYLFLLNTATAMEQLKPGAARQFIRAQVIYQWPYINLYAPELAGQFLNLERTTRVEGAPAPKSLTETWEESGRKSYEEKTKLARQTKDAIDLENAFRSALGYQDFAEARKLLDLMKEGATKRRLTENLNTREALHLAERGDTAGAERLARQLMTPQAILNAYPRIIRRMVKDKDAASASVLVSEVVRRLKRGELSPDEPYVPAELASMVGPLIDRSSKLPRVLSELATEVAPVNNALALEILGELVEEANRAGVNTENGNAGFNTHVFHLLAARDETNVRQAAQSLKDRLQRISALAAIYGWKATTLAAATPASHTSR